MPRLRFIPNQPVTLKLENPEGDYDFDLQVGRYRTQDGREVQLPRPAVIVLNELAPAPGEEIGICLYRGKRGQQDGWAIWLTAQSEKTRAQAEDEPQELTEVLQASIDQARSRKPTKEPVTPIRRKPAGKQDDQPRLFDRGTGTYGPAPLTDPALRPAALRKTPYGQMLRAIVRTVESVLKAEGLQLGDGPKQDLISTVYIDAAKRQGVEYDFTTEAK